MNKQETLVVLRLKMEQIPSLLASGPRSESFEKWKRDTAIVIKHLFDNSEAYVNEFKSIHYFPVVYASEQDVITAFQRGMSKARALLLSMIEEYENYYLDFEEQIGSEIKDCSTKSNEIFIVHGHDELAKREVSETLLRLNLKPIILHEQVNEGNTIIEKLETHSNCKFAVVILSPDDFGGENETNLKSRARQNVIFEMGFFIGKLGRRRVCVLAKDEVEKPSDVHGLMYISYEDAWKYKLCDELKSAGYDVSKDLL